MSKPMKKPNVRPMTPSEVSKIKIATLPPEVFEEFNRLIVAGYNQGEAKVNFSKVKAAIAKRLNISGEEVLNRGYLDIEEAYRLAGWDVEFDKPGYNEAYLAKYVFTVR